MFHNYFRRRSGFRAAAGFLGVLGMVPVVWAQTGPAYQWSKAFGSATNDQGNAVALDANGNAYVTGFFTGTASFGAQTLTCTNSGGCLFLTKFGPDGTTLWAKKFNNDFGAGKAVAVDAGGNILLAGVFTNADFGCGAITGSIFAAKLTPDGSCLWAKGYRSVATAGAGNAGGNDILNGLAVDSSGGVFLTGKFGCSTSEGCAVNFGGGSITSLQNPSYGGVFLAKLSGTDGSHRWSKAYGGVSGMDYASGVAVDASGDAFVTGYFSSASFNLGGTNLTSAGSVDGFVAKFRGTDGASLWSKRFGGVSDDLGAAIAIDSTGAALITGQFQSTADFGGISLTSAYFMYADIVLARYASTDGTTLWAKRFGNTAADTGRAITTDGNGHVSMAGYFMSTVDFGSGFQLTSTGGLDVFLAQYNVADGSLVWAKRGGGASSDLGLGVATDNGGNAVMTGYFQGPGDFGGTSMSAGGAYDIVVAKYGTASTKATATVTLSNLTQTYTGSPLTPTATTSPAGLAIVWTNAPQTNAGSYAVTATINDPNYQGSASATFTINKATASVTLGSLTQTYTGNPLTPAATTNPAGLAVVWTNAPQTNAGSYAVTATINDPNYQGSASGTFTITSATKTAATVTLSNLTQTYTGAPLMPTATTNPPGLAVVWTNAPQTNAGSYAVTATINDANYQGSASGTFTINKATASVTLGSLTQTYTGNPLTPTATTNPAGLAIVWTNAPQTNTGSYAVTATVNNANYQGSASATFTITSAGKTAATVTLSNLTQTYTGGPLMPTATTNPAGLAVVWTNAPQTNAGSYAVTATINDANYQGSASGTFTINKATAFVSLTNLTQTYTGGPLTPNAATNPAGLPIVWTNAPQTSVGSYAVTATVNNPNYQGSASATFTITSAGKTAATVTLSNLTQTYSGGPLMPTATTNPAGLAVVWTNAPQTNAGSYAVTATINDANYQGSASGTFTINKATATVSLTNLTQTYTGGPLTPSAATNPAGLAIVWTNAPQTSVGSYVVTATVNNPNYQGSASGTFTITSATKTAATVTLSNLTQTYTGAPLMPMATTNPPGLAVVWTNAPQTNAGSYAVTATINDANYQGSASGTFTINKATATVSLTNLTQTYTGGPLTPSAATNPAGLAVVWTNAPQTSVGSYVVTATVNNLNYQGSASGTFTIAAAVSTPPSVSITSPANGGVVAVKSIASIQAAVTAGSNPIARVDFLINGAVQCSGMYYSCSWLVPNAPGRSYSLQTMVTDSAGLSRSSGIVTVTSGR